MMPTTGVVCRFAIAEGSFAICDLQFAIGIQLQIANCKSQIAWSIGIRRLAIGNEHLALAPHPFCFYSFTV
jgi:hypothetical protein